MASSQEEKAVKVQVAELNYRQLQVKAGELGLRKTGKTEELRDRVVSALSGQKDRDAGVLGYESADFISGDETLASPRSSKKRAKAPPKSAKASTRKRVKAEVEAAAEAAEEQAEHVKDQVVQAAGRSQRAAAGLLHSLQRTPQTLYSYATRTGDSVRESVSQLQLGSRFQQAWESVSPKEPSTDRDRRKKRRSKAADVRSARKWLPSLTTSLVLLLVASATFGGAAYLALQHRQQMQQVASSSWHSVQRGASTASKAGQEAVGAAVHGAQAGLESAGSGASQLLHSSQRGLHGAWHYVKGLATFTRDPAGRHRDALAVSVVDGMLPKQPQWSGLRTSMQDLLAGHRLDSSKAPAILLAGTEAASHRAAAYLVLSIFRRQPDKAHCTLLLRGASLSRGDAEARGQLQAQLVSLVEGCSHAMVVVDGLHKMHPGLQPVWINALSERGGFTVGGQHISTSQTLFFFTIAVPDDILSLATEETLSAGVKNHLESTLHVKRETPLDSAETAAFRRRLDIVVPLQR